MGKKKKEPIVNTIVNTNENTIENKDEIIMKRKDISDKRKMRKISKETVIKCKLNKFIRLDELQKREFMNLIEEAVIDFSIRTNNCMLALNLIIRELFDNKESLQDIKNVNLDNIINIVPLKNKKAKKQELANKDIFFINESFIRQLCLGTEDAIYKFVKIIENHQNNPDLLYDTSKRLHGDRNIYSHGAIQLITNIKNHIILNFPRILKLYVNSIENVTKNQKFSILYDINGWNKPESFEETNIEYYELIQTIRKFLNLKNGDSINKVWLSNFKNTNIEIMLKFIIYANKYFIKKNQINKRINEFNKKNKIKNKQKYKNIVKLFNILPISNITRKYITIDHSVLIGFMQEMKDFKDFQVYKEIYKNNERFISLKHNYYYNTIFELEKRKDKYFTGTIQTDGIAVCIHYRKEKMEIIATDNQLLKDKNNRIIAFDPGRTNILYGIEKINNIQVKKNNSNIKNRKENYKENKKIKKQEYKIYCLKRREYYNDSGISKANNNSRKWNSYKKIKETIQKLSKVSSKYATLINYKLYLQTYLKQRINLIEEYFKKRWSEQRFRTYCGKKRTLKKFFNKIQDPNDERKIIIAYGSAKVSPTGKNEVSVPTSQIFKECCFNYKTIIVDEFRTSKIYYKNNSLLNLVGKKNVKTGKHFSLRGLLWSGSSKTGNFVNRDFNAAINILRCATSRNRPHILKRGDVRLPKQHIKNILKR